MADYIDAVFFIKIETEWIVGCGHRSKQCSINRNSVIYRFLTVMKLLILIQTSSQHPSWAFCEINRAVILSVHGNYQIISSQHAQSVRATPTMKFFPDVNS